MRQLLCLLLLMSVTAWAEPAPQLRVPGLPDHEVYAYFNATASHLTLDSHNELRVWALTDFRLLKHLKFQVNQLVSHDVSPDGRFLAVSIPPRRIQVHDLRSQKVVFEFSGLKPKESEGAYRVSFSPNGDYLSAFGSGRARENSDRYLRVWRTADWQREGLALCEEERWWGWLEVVWTPWNQLAHLESDKRGLTLYDPKGLRAARKVVLAEEGVNLIREKDEIVALTRGSGSEHTLLQRLRQTETSPRVETRLDFQKEEERPMTRLVSDLWMSPIGYGGPATVYAGSEPKAIGALEWACPPETSFDGKLLAFATLKGVLVLDVEKTLASGKLIPYRP